MTTHAQRDVQYQLHPFTLDKVAIHKSKGSLWIIIRDAVYDVTSWQAVHPGGGSPGQGFSLTLTAPRPR